MLRSTRGPDQVDTWSPWATTFDFLTIVLVLICLQALFIVPWDPTLLRACVPVFLLVLTRTVWRYRNKYPGEK